MNTSWGRGGGGTTHKQTSVLPHRASITEQSKDSTQVYFGEPMSLIMATYGTGDNIQAAIPLKRVFLFFSLY